MLGSQHNWAGSSEDSHVPLSPHRQGLCAVSTQRHSGPFATIDGPPMTRYYQPKSTVLMRVHSWCYMFCGFEQTYDDMYPPQSIIESNFTVLKTLCASPVHPSHRTSLANTDVFPVSMVLPFPEYHSVGWAVF